VSGYGRGKREKKRYQEHNVPQSLKGEDVGVEMIGRERNRGETRERPYTLLFHVL